MVLYQAKAQPVGDPADWVEPVFFDGWWVPPVMVSEEAHQNAQSAEVNPGEPIAAAPAFSIFGWERPAELPLRREPDNAVADLPYMIDPSLFIEPVFLDGWYQQRDRPMRVAGIPPFQAQAHTIAEEDFEAPFSTFGWERPPVVPGPVELANTAHETFDPDYEAIISTPDLVEFTDWNPPPFIPPMPELVHFKIPSMFFEIDPASLLRAPPATGTILNITVAASRNRLSVPASKNTLGVAASRNKLEL